MGYLPQYNDIDKKFPISIYEVVLSGLSRQKRFMKPYSKAQHECVRHTIERMELKGLEKTYRVIEWWTIAACATCPRHCLKAREVVILDEPNTYIDQRFQEQMYKMLEAINLVVQ